jgi:hypothetical protein
MLTPMLAVAVETPELAVAFTVTIPVAARGTFFVIAAVFLPPGASVSDSGTIVLPHIEGRLELNSNVRGGQVALSLFCTVIVNPAI